MARSRRTDRTPGPRPPPIGRSYGVVFGRVWTAALDAARSTARWSVTASDPVRGEIVVEVRPLLFGGTAEARVRIALDDLGLTRVDASFFHPTGERAEGARGREIARFYRALERRLLAEGAR